MNKAELRKNINQTAKSIKKDHKESLMDGQEKTQAVDIQHHQLYIAFNCKNLFFQGEEAQELWDEANKLSDKSGASIENCLLFLSSSWG